MFYFGQESEGRGRIEGTPMARNVAVLRRRLQPHGRVK